MLNHNTTRVYLIGAGPGDPSLLTLKAKRAIESADVILYDYLVHPNIVMMGPQAEWVCVGKKKGAHSATQQDINQRLLDEVAKGRVVARLKGGDPMVFGRSGEEMTTLKEHNIPFEVIPGITSAIAVPTYAGIPITHRDASHSVAFVTATRANDIENMDVPTADTVVIMMCLFRLSSMVKRLIEQRGAHTPICVIQSGTYARERIIVGTLATIESLYKEQPLNPPALMVVGDVVNLRIDWRHHLPLRHHRFVITRAPHQQSDLADRLTQLGAEVLTLSMNHITPQLSALSSVVPTNVNYLIFTSQNGVDGFFKSLAHTGGDIRQWAHACVVAIGGKTAASLSAYGIVPDAMPDQATSAGLVDLLSHRLSADDSVLIPTSSESDRLLDPLANTGATIQYLTMYTNHVPDHVKHMAKWVHADDHLIMMNRASVDRMIQVCPAIQHHRIYSMGPQTTAALRAHGCTRIQEAPSPSLDAMMSLILSDLM